MKKYVVSIFTATIAIILAAWFLLYPVLRSSAVNGRIEVSVRPFVLDPSLPDRQDFGKLTWRGGIVITSSDRRYGGFSGLAVDRSGSYMLTVSDRGHWLGADIVTKDGVLTGIANPKLDPLRARNGRILAKKKTQDAEAIALHSGSFDNGKLLIGFERLHRIGVFPIRQRNIFAPERYLKLPGRLYHSGFNEGIESLAVIRGGEMQGTVIVFPERMQDANGNLIGALIGGPAPGYIKLVERDGFSITGLATLPDGGVLLLERRFRILEGFKMRIRKISAKAILPGALLDGEILFHADNSFAISNMEGIAVHENATGETIITVISDDNFSYFLRTILMQFILS
jgi:hypothetical protein